jgi:hypothetical protein
MEPAGERPAAEQYFDDTHLPRSAVSGRRVVVPHPTQNSSSQLGSPCAEMELATSQLLFLLAIGVFAALGYAAYRYFAKPTINILDQLKEQVCV